ncbi:uncharacterized protein [Cicer arietinum]|uniref:Uncharacterized protein LOC101511880 isoform X2 n=1 Tax=Cicer arietinum TaxID=3827 RepID=A0A3Q7X059_CICAR|nr:uncharacterized protein LOC101511880 isoform X2 [Cicer arietinum]
MMFLRTVIWTLTSPSKSFSLKMKEAIDSRTRGNSMGLSRGGKIGIGNDPGILQSGLAHVAYKENGKAVDKQEVGSVCTSVISSTTHVVDKSSKTDSFKSDNGRQSLGIGVSMSDTAQVSPGPQPWSTGVSKGHLSMADIVRMGRTSQDAVSHNHCNSLGVSSSGNSESSLSLHCQNSSEQQGFHDEWPVIKQPFPGNQQVLTSSSNANGLFEHPNLHGTAESLHRNCELDAAQVSREEITSGSAISETIESVSVSNNTGLGSHANFNLENTPTSNFPTSDEHHEGVSPVVLDLQQLSMEESKLEVPSSEDSLVVLPNHLQALAAECSHLSFGTYKGSNNSSSSAIFAHNNLSRSGLEMNSAAVDDSLAQFPDASSLNHGDDQRGFDTVKNGGEQLGSDVVRLGTSVDKSFDFLSTPWQELVKHTVSEETLGHQYSTTASISDPSLQKSHWPTPSLPLKQPGLQSGSHSSFPGELHNNSNSAPQDLLAFLIAQSQRARHANAEPSVNNFPLSMSEDMEPFALRNPSLPTQGCTVPNIHFQQSRHMKAYPSLPQNQSYLSTIDSQRAFLDNTAYNRFPANMNYNNLPQNRNEFLKSRLPPSIASDAHGYGNLDSSFYCPGSFLPNPSLANVKPSSNINEILPSQYNGGYNLSSNQRHGSFSQRDYGAKSRSSLIHENTQYTFMDQPSQSSLLQQYASPGYPDFYYSPTQLPEKHNQSGSVQDLSPSQLHQFWQNSH